MNYKQGDIVDTDIRWYDERDPTLRMDMETDDVVMLNGDDGHSYRINKWDGKVLCLTDDKPGSHRGQIIP